MDPATIISLAKLISSGVTEIIPLFIHRDDNGNVVKVTAGVFLEQADTEGRNKEILETIAKANAEPTADTQ